MGGILNEIVDSLMISNNLYL